MLKSLFQSIWTIIFNLKKIEWLHKKKIWYQPLAYYNFKEYWKKEKIRMMLAIKLVKILLKNLLILKIKEIIDILKQAG